MSVILANRFNIVTKILPKVLIFLKFTYFYLFYLAIISFFYY
jgi:hypothetical protein